MMFKMFISLSMMILIVGARIAKRSVMPDRAGLDR